MRLERPSEQSRKRSVFCGARRVRALTAEWGADRLEPDALRERRCACGSVRLGWLALLLCFSTLLAADQRSRRDEGVSLAIAGEYQRAYEIFRELLHDAPDDPLLNYYTGAACVRLNRQAEGMEYLEKAVRREAPFPQAYQELGEAYLKKKLNTQARDVVEKGLARFPKNHPLQKLRAKIQKLIVPEG